MKCKAKILNLVFHRIFLRESDVEDIYDCSLDFFNDLLKEVIKQMKSSTCNYSDFRIYFDDGHESFLELVYPHLTSKLKNRTTLAIITNKVGNKEYISKGNILMFSNKGIKISSHSTSHPGMAVCTEQFLRPTPRGGKYENVETTLSVLLKEEEVRYQLKESKKFLEQIAAPVDEFVFPYGIYNSDIIRLNYQFSYYKYLSTCDEYLDCGEYIRPRILVTSDKSVSETLQKIMSLKEIDKIKLLTKYE